ncbi:MAG: hypothetical protein WCF67_09970 [Chitinophagaceae bacterium]
MQLIIKLLFPFICVALAAQAQPVAPAPQPHEGYSSEMLFQFEKSQNDSYQSACW